MRINLSIWRSIKRVVSPNRWLSGVLFTCVSVLIPASVSVSASALVEVPPGLDTAGLQAFQNYSQKADHRAFAIGTAGAWGWLAGAASPTQAAETALQRCRMNANNRRCVIYSQNGRTQFQPADWRTLWHPYQNAGDAKKAKQGLVIGQRFPDLVYRDTNGHMTHVSKQQGKVVVLHFWGSWCPPCRNELPEFAALYKKLATDRRITFVALPVRESKDTAQRWMKRERIELPLSESGQSVEDDGKLVLTNGQRIPDRDIAAIFPSTYVLDRHGLILFSHEGPLHDWSAYAPLLLDAATYSGQ